MLEYYLAVTVHLAGVIFWLGGVGTRLVLLDSMKSGVNEGWRSQFYQAQRKIHLMLETPAFVVALLAGWFLAHAAKVKFSHSWFQAKIVLILGLIAVGLLVSRQFKAFNTSGRAGQAAPLLVGLVVFTVLTLFAVLTKF